MLTTVNTLHSSGLGGHSGITATYHKVKSLFARPKMKQRIKEYISKCELCAQAKPKHCKLPNLLQPLPIPSHAWHTISLDFIEGLPLLGSANAIVMVIDKFSKFAHFIPLKHPFSAA